MKFAAVGKWVFIVGLVLAGIAGLFFQAEWVIWMLAILGVIVGLVNVTQEETQSFMLAAVAFALFSTALDTVPLLGGLISNILGYVKAFVAGATVVVALKTLFVIAQQRSSAP